MERNLFTAERYRLQPEQDCSKPPSAAHSAAEAAAADARRIFIASNHHNRTPYEVPV